MSAAFGPAGRRLMDDELARALQSLEPQIRGGDSGMGGGEDPIRRYLPRLAETFRDPGQNYGLAGPETGMAPQATEGGGGLWGGLGDALGESPFKVHADLNARGGGLGGVLALAAMLGNMQVNRARGEGEQRKELNTGLRKSAQAMATRRWEAARESERDRIREAQRRSEQARRDAETEAKTMRTHVEVAMPDGSRKLVPASSQLPSKTSRRSPEQIGRDRVAADQAEAAERKRQGLPTGSRGKTGGARRFDFMSEGESKALTGADAGLADAMRGHAAAANDTTDARAFPSQSKRPADRAKVASMREAVRVASDLVSARRASAFGTRKSHILNALRRAARTEGDEREDAVGQITTYLQSRPDLLSDPQVKAEAGKLYGGR